MEEHSHERARLTTSEFAQISCFVRNLGHLGRPGEAFGKPQRQKPRCARARGAHSAHLGLVRLTVPELGESRDPVIAEAVHRPGFRILEDESGYYIEHDTRTERVR